MEKEYFLLVNGKKVKVSEEVYKIYWEERNHENYLKKLNRKKILFREVNENKIKLENIADDNIDIEKIVQTHIMIEELKKAISNLSNDEKEIIQKLYFDEEALRLVAKDKNISHSALIKKRNKILKKLKKLLKDF